MFSEDSWLYAAIGLTKQQDGHSLTGHMVGLLRSMSFVRGADAYEVFGGGGDGDGLVFRRFTDELREKRVPADEPGLARSARTVSRVEEALNDGQVRLVFPVQSEAGPLRLVTLDGGDLSPERRVLLMGLVELYENQVNVMDSKERDSLTGLLNRQTFDLRLMQVAQSCLAEGHEAWLGALDIDHFKRVNDTYGHLMGDEVLLRFAQNMQQHFRYTDFLFRFGGEEFIVLLTNTNAQGARQAFERFRSVISNFDFPSVGRVTVSIGYTRIEPGNLPTTLVDWSDRALYHAKEHGRDQVVAYDDIRQAGDIGAGSDVELF